MKSFTAVIIDPIGLHARPAALTVKAANKFESDVKIICNDRSGNLKSILNTMSLGIKCGQEFTVEASGKDEFDCVKNIEKSMKESKLIN